MAEAKQAGNGVGHDHDGRLQRDFVEMKQINETLQKRNETLQQRNAALEAQLQVLLYYHYLVLCYCIIGNHDIYCTNGGHRSACASKQTCRCWYSMDPKVLVVDWNLVYWHAIRWAEGRWGARHGGGWEWRWAVGYGCAHDGRYAKELYVEKSALGSKEWLDVDQSLSRVEGLGFRV